ncbi:EF-hand domain-containing protein [Caulobacter segnis]
MILRTLIAAGFVTALAGPALAQAASSAPAKAPTQAEGMTLQQFQAANGDKMFARLDTNKDGKISREEFAAFREGNAKVDAQATKAGKRGEKLFSRFDKDKDGALSRTEADAVLAWRFKRMDANADGVLSLEELQAKHGKAKVGV